MNTSATGGYLQPGSTLGLPNQQTFENFIQSVFSGISGLPGSLVRPRWQIDPPKQPDVTIDWLAISITESDADFTAFLGIDSNGNNQFMRMEEFTVQCEFYGPNSYENMKLLRDGFQIPDNREALQSAKMDFVSTDRATRAPDLVNERWCNRWIMQAHFRREILRSYPILNLVSSAGTLTVNDAGAGKNTVAV